MRVAISTGVGHLHFAEAVAALRSYGHSVRLITGWMPRNPVVYRLADILGQAMGHKGLSERLVKRWTIGNLTPSEVRSCALSEGLYVAAQLLSTLRVIPESRGQALTWALFGLASSRFVPKADVFQVRSGAGFGAINLAKALNIPVITDHSIAHPKYMRAALADVYARFGLDFEFEPDAPFWSRVLKDCWEADVLLVNSDFVKSTFVGEGYPAERIRVVYLGVADSFFSIRHDYRRQSSALRVLFTGKFGLRKGAHVLIEAISQLERSGLPIELQVVGDASEYLAFRHVLPTHTAPTLLGWMPPEKFVSYLATADVYAFPTFAEGCARSAMEALAAGIPVVTTKACGLPAKPGEHYLEVPPGDSKALALAISALARSERQSQTIGEAGANLVREKYRWCDYASSVSAVYNDLLKARAKHSATGR